MVFVCSDDDDDDLDDVDVLVDVLLVVIVRVVVDDGLKRFVGGADFDRVVVLVDVFDCVEVAVGITCSILICSGLYIATDCCCCSGPIWRGSANQSSNVRRPSIFISGHTIILNIL